jgi:hypothetical protein
LRKLYHEFNWAGTVKPPISPRISVTFSTSLDETLEDGYNPLPLVDKPTGISEAEKIIFYRAKVTLIKG